MSCTRASLPMVAVRMHCSRDAGAIEKRMAPGIGG